MLFGLPALVAADPCGELPEADLARFGEPRDAGFDACVAQTCQQQGVECGPATDGCGNDSVCPNCQTGLVCGDNACMLGRD